jgi:outer membrane biosynthesis protein TonB
MEFPLNDIWYNRSDNEKKSALITTIIVVLLLLLFWLIKLNNEQKKEDNQLVIDFTQQEVYAGANSADEGEAGDGGEVKPVTEPVTESKPVPQPKVTTPITSSSKPVLTSNNAEMIAMKKAEEERKKELKAEQERLAKIEEERKKQEAFKQKMNTGFTKGKNSGTNSGDGDGGGGWGGDGTSKNPGDGDGLGSGSGSGPSLNLGNRKFVSVVKPDDNSNLEGIVVIRITVDKKGNITNAEFKSTGSTTTNSILVQKSIKAALQSKVTQDFNAAEDQFGTITYKYKNSE